jgi:hypothetical protein
MQPYRNPVSEIRIQSEPGSREPSADLEKSGSLPTWVLLKESVRGFQPFGFGGGRRPSRGLGERRPAPPPA